MGGKWRKTSRMRPRPLVQEIGSMWDYASAGHIEGRGTGRKLFRSE